MKIFHATDLHFNKQFFNQIASMQNEFDVFCLSGDFLNPFIDVPLREQAEWIKKWLKNFEKPLFVCSGNHDIEFDEGRWLNEVKNIYSDNTKKEIQGIKFCSIPYIGAQFSEFYDCDVILYHLPPSGTLTSTHRKTFKEWGDREVATLLKNGVLSPKLFLCGHLHKPLQTQDKIKTTLISNPGNDEKLSFNLFDI